MEVVDGGSDQFNTTDDPTFGDVSIGGETGSNHVTGILEMNVLIIFSYIPSAVVVDETIEPLVGGIINKNAIVVTPAIGVVGEGGGDVVEHGVVGEGGSAVASGDILVVVARNIGGQRIASAVGGGVVGIAIPATIN